MPTTAALSAAAASTPCPCYGKVVHVADGDTVDVDVAGDGTTRPIRVRLTGINAMELTTYSNDPQKWRGECHGVAAARRLYSLVQGRTVRLTAQDARSRSGQRYRRRVWVHIGGAWKDVALILLAEGHGLFLPNGTEYAPDRAAAAAAEYAASRRLGLWDSDACGRGPAQGADLRVAVAWDAPGDDARNPTVKTSRSPEPLPVHGGPLGLVGAGLRGPRLRAARLRLPVGHAAAGRGCRPCAPRLWTDTTTDLYWRIGAPIFENATGSPTYMGDGGYLFDPQGDLRAWEQYPCRYRCPAQLSTSPKHGLDCEPETEAMLQRANIGRNPGGP